jgi:hypothetical protein
VCGLTQCLWVVLYPEALNLIAPVSKHMSPGQGVEGGWIKKGTVNAVHMQDVYYVFDTCDVFLHAVRMYDHRPVVPNFRSRHKSGSRGGGGV